MIDLIDSKCAGAIDKYTINTLGVPSLLLMEEAAKFSFEQIRQDYGKQSKILIVCGSGNNGGDGLALLRMLILAGYKNTEALILGSHYSEQNLEQQRILESMGITLITEFNKPSKDYDLIVDAIFGVGLNRQVEGKYKEIIEFINNSQAMVYSLDVPSGINASTGAILGVCVKANKTFTFGYEKIGLFCGDGAYVSGKVISTPVCFNDKEALIEIGRKASLDSELKVFEKIGQVKAITGNILKDDNDYSKEVNEVLRKRKRGGNKGSYGKVTIIAGSKNMGGAAILSALTALRMGVGMVKLLTHKNNKEAVLSVFPECLIDVYDDDISEDLIQSAIDFGDSLVIGPGLSRDNTALKLTKYVLEHVKTKLVIDADALNIIAENSLQELLKRDINNGDKKIIITPHLKEMERLTGIKLQDVKKDMVNIALNFSKKYGVITVLKDAKTVIADGDYAVINQAGNDGMATAGSGDVLTGVVVGLLNLGLSEFTSAVVAVNVHANAGDLAAANLTAMGIIAGDISRSVAQVMAETVGLVEI